MKELIEQYHQQQNSTTGPRNIKGVPQWTENFFIAAWVFKCSGFITVIWKCTD